MNESIIISSDRLMYIHLYRFYTFPLSKRLSFVLQKHFNYTPLFNNQSTSRLHVRPSFDDAHPHISQEALDLRPPGSPPSSLLRCPHLSHSHTFSSSAFALRSTAYAYFDFNFLHWKRHCFSTQPALELSAGKIVDMPLAQTGEETTKSLDSDQLLVNVSASATAALGNSNNAELLDSDLEKGKRAAGYQHLLVLKEDVLNFAAKKGIIRNAYAALHADNVEQPQGAEGCSVTPECQAHFSANTSQITVNGPHQVPSLNSCFKEDSMEIIFKGSHNIGVAMATPNGLGVPNIKNVQSLSILEWYWTQLWNGDLGARK
ncbi:Lipoamide acyltransferase component of branched-chain alpha-keto acid dehydrogenase complex [Arachis hypogaea]|nr:Lipoamide acyltransferase component of branched-chain alpha-keto acid dehydrogenase complex [Arachis hypogaea]